MRVYCFEASRIYDPEYYDWFRITRIINFKSVSGWAVAVEFDRPDAANFRGHVTVAPEMFITLSESLDGKGTGGNQNCLKLEQPLPCRRRFAVLFVILYHTIRQEDHQSA